MEDIEIDMGDRWADVSLGTAEAVGNYMSVLVVDKPYAAQDDYARLRFIKHAHNRETIVFQVLLPVEDMDALAINWLWFRRGEGLIIPEPEATK